MPSTTMALQPCTLQSGSGRQILLIMILAMAMGHTVGRSAMGMGEGKILWSG